MIQRYNYFFLLKYAPVMQTFRAPIALLIIMADSPIAPSKNHIPVMSSISFEMDKIFVHLMECKFIGIK